MRESEAAAEEALIELFKTAREQAPQAWLLYLEMLELAPAGGKLAGELGDILENIAAAEPEQQLLIERGIKLLDNSSLAA